MRNAPPGCPRRSARRTRARGRRRVLLVDLPGRGGNGRGRAERTARPGGAPRRPPPDSAVTSVAGERVLAIADSTWSVDRGRTNRTARTASCSLLSASAYSVRFEQPRRAATSSSVSLGETLRSGTGPRARRPADADGVVSWSATAKVDSMAVLTYPVQYRSCDRAVPTCRQPEGGCRLIVDRVLPTDEGAELVALVREIAVERARSAGRRRRGGERVPAGRVRPARRGRRARDAYPEELRRVRPAVRGVSAGAGGDRGRLDECRCRRRPCTS